MRRKSGIFSLNRSKALRLPRRLPPRAQISINRVVVESPLIEDVFVCGTRFLRMYIHCVWSRHWPSPLTHQYAASDRARLVADKLAIGKEPKEARRGCAIAIAIMGRRQPGFSWLSANGELVGDKPCAIARSILVGEW